MPEHSVEPLEAAEAVGQCCYLFQLGLLIQQNGCLTSFGLIFQFKIKLIKQLWDMGELEKADPVEQKLKSSDSSWR